MNLIPTNQLLGLALYIHGRSDQKLISREDQFDYYDYGDDQEEWTADDHYSYYGANTAESCLSYYSPTYNTDWHASTNARTNTHNTDVSAGDLFGDTYVTDPDDSYPLLAHSAYASTWPKRINPMTNRLEPFWPGWWAQDYNINLPGCSQSKRILTVGKMCQVDLFRIWTYI